MPENFVLKKFDTKKLRLKANQKFAKNMTAWAKDYSKQVHKDYVAYDKYLQGEE